MDSPSTSLSYASAPIRLEHPAQTLSLDSGGAARFTLPTGGPPRTVAAERLHDLMLPTLLSLLEDLTPGTPLMTDFLAEWEHAQTLLAEPGSPAWLGYGDWFYYPSEDRLARFAPRKWHRLSLVVRNATLLSVPDAPHDWARGRAALDDVVLAVAGCSVGSNLLHSAVMLLRPGHVKVADVKDYHLNNANRVRVTYRDFGRNKAVVCAEQLHATDPFLGVSVFGEGLSRDNVERFVKGDATQGEPPTTVVVEETDDFEVKLLLRVAARAARVPLVMATDIGSAAAIDVRRFDREPDLPLVPGMSDSALRDLHAAWNADSSDRSVFYELAYAYSGREELHRVRDFKEIATREVLTPFSGIPQLGSTAAMAGGLGAWTIARILLGYPVWERVFFDATTAQVHTLGEPR